MNEKKVNIDDQPQEGMANPGKRRLLTLIYILSAILLALLLIAIVVSGIQRPDSLKGTWINDESEIFQFDGLGQGVLILEDDLRRFEYTIADNEVRIDYLKDEVFNQIFTYGFENEQLILVDDDGHETAYRPNN